MMTFMPSPTLLQKLITGRRHGWPAVRLRNQKYNDTPKLDRVVFVCGLHRSGTTLLERMLAARFELSYLRADVPESEGQHMQSVYRTARDHGGPGRFAFSRTMRDELPALGDPRHCRERIIADWHRFVVGDSTTLLEKSPPNLTKIEWLRRVFPEGRFVIMARDPRAVSAATQKWSKTSLPELMMHWNVAYAQAMEDYCTEDCTVVRYEDLTEASGPVIERLGEFLQLVPRAASDALESRHSGIRNSNTDYIEMHKGTRYGAGIWNRFGYDV
jgi:hypothetical protein